jgi:hypothetical protein
MKTIHAPFAPAFFQHAASVPKNSHRIRWLTIFRQHVNSFASHVVEQFTMPFCHQPPTKNTIAVSLIIAEIFRFIGSFVQTGSSSPVQIAIFFALSVRNMGCGFLINFNYRIQIYNFLKILNEAFLYFFLISRTSSPFICLVIILTISEI